MNILRSHDESFLATLETGSMYRHLREWAPFVTNGSRGTVGTVKLTWAATPTPLETRVMQADAPKVLEYNDIRWELEAFGGGTRLTLWHSIDRRFIAWGAAGWHICFDVLDRLLARPAHWTHRRHRCHEVRRLAAIERGIGNAVRY